MSGWGVERFALGFVVAALLAAPGAARADTTVNFDDQAAGTTITDQYANLGGTGQGVIFGPLPGGAVDGLSPHVDVAPAGQAESSPNVADIDTASGVEFPSPITTGTFMVPRSRVSVYVGWLQIPEACSNPATDNGCAVVTLTAYDASGDPVGTPDSATVTADGGIHTQLSVSTPTAEIVGFEIAGRNADDEDKLIAIDNLSFDTPVTPPTPDFTLTPAHASITVAQNATAADSISIGRLGGSSGNVSFALSGTLPAGVQASFSPNPAGDGSTTLTLSADPDAPPTSGASSTVTVTGTPSGPAVGTAPRSFTLTVAVQPAFTISVGETTNVSLSGCTATVPLYFTRSLSFPGPLGLSVSGLPAGVQATFSSSPITFATGDGQTTATMNLIAPANGQTLPTSTVTVTASAPPLADQSATFTVGGACPLQYDPEVTSIQITQGVQSPYLPAQDYSTHPASVVPYSEITPTPAELRSGGTTVVRLYADLAFGPAGGVANVPAVLVGYTHDEIGNVVGLPGSPLLPTASPSTLTVGPATATSAQEGSETAAYTFTLPPSWTHGKITVIGELEPSQTPQVTQGQTLAPCETIACNENDALTLSAIPFYDTPTVTIDPVQMQVNGAQLPDPSTVFQWAKLVTPLPMTVAPYQGTIDITDLANTFNTCVANHHGQAEYQTCSDNANNDVSSRFDDWVCDHGEPDSPGWDMGINTGVARGLTNYDDICWSSFDIDADSVVEYKRPLTSVAHEFFHLLGRPHASYCGGGGANGQTAETWPPDQMGYTQSVGLDTSLGSGLNGGPYAVPSPPGQTWYDFMSYCANGDDTASPLTLTPAPSWGSVHNWNAVMEAFRYHAADQPAPRPRTTSARRPSLLVSGFLFHDGSVQISTVTPLQAASRALPSSGFELVGLDGAGHQVTSAPMMTETLHVDREVPPVGLDGVIPAAGVTSVEVLGSGGTVLATRAASAHAPTISLRGVPVTHGATTTIRWRAHDSDREPLVAAIDYSSNDGRSYKRIWIGPSDDLVRLPSRYLSRSRRARVEVTVNDGFWSATVRSRRFTAPGAPPAVTILSPERGAQEPSDAPLLLSGQAFDDTGTALTGKRLRWFLGKRLLGRGEQIADAGLPPGRDRIVVLARDRFGRIGRASVVVRLRASRPLFLLLSVPKRIKRTARSLKLKVESSIVARLTVRSSARRKTERFSVSRRIRTVRVRIVRGSKRLKLRLSLSAGGLTRTVSISVRR